MFDNGQGKFVPAPIDFRSDRLVLLLYGTGFDHVSGPGDVTVAIGQTLLTVDYAGSQHQFLGLDQINAELPNSLAGLGEVTVNVTVAGKTANPVTIAFK